MAVDGPDGLRRPGNKIAIKNAEVATPVGPAVLLLEMPEPGGGEFRVLQRLLALFLQGGVDPFPDRVKDADVGGDRLGRVAEDVDDAGVGKLLAEAEHRTGELGGLGEQDFVFSVQVEMALQAGAVVAHQPPAFRLRQIVGKAGPPKQAHVGEKQVNGLRDEGVDEKAVVLLRLGQPHFVHVVPTSEKAPFHPGDQKTQKAVPVAAEPGDSQNDFLEKDAGKDRLIHQHWGERLTVLGQHFLQKGGSAAGRGDDEDRLADRLPAEAGKKKMIEGAARGHHDPERGQEQHEKGDDQPAPQVERATQIGVSESLGS